MDTRRQGVIRPGIEVFVRTATLLLSTLLLFSATGCDRDKGPTPEEMAALVDSKLKDAETMLRNNKVKEAEELYLFALEQQPDNAVALTGLGRVKLEQSDVPGAVEVLKKAAAAPKANADAHAALGDALVLAEDHAGAAGAFAKAFELDGENATVGLRLGIAQRESKQLAESESTLKATAELDEDVQFVFTELGDTLRAQEKHPEALKAYMRAQTIYKSDKRAHAGAAFVYEAQGKFKAATDEWSAYIQRDCCSEYSKTVAHKKIKELELKEQEALKADGTEGGE